MVCNAKSSYIIKIFLLKKLSDSVWSGFLFLCFGFFGFYFFATLVKVSQCNNQRKAGLKLIDVVE